MHPIDVALMTRLSPATGTAELLQYLPEYKVVICATCRYAIQPNAIERHLKELHKFRRDSRRPFMQYISKLDLDIPDKVREIRNTESPVPLLPVHDGLRCMHEGCTHLCVSAKRMKGHWLSAHGRSGHIDFDWHPVPLQTFFRGNLLRYFTNSDVHPAADSTRSDISINTSDRYSEKLNWNRDDVDVTDLPSISGLLLQSQLDEIDSTLLQHYITSTSLSLTTDARTKTMWQVTVPRIASQFPFLLHGILACAALHLAYLDPGQGRELMIRGRVHQDRAMPLFRSAIESPNRDNCDAVFAFSHLLVIYSFAAEREDERLFLVESNALEVLPSWLYFIRSGCSMLCDVWDQLESGPVGSLVSAWEIPITFSEAGQEPLMDSLLSAIPLQGSEDSWSEDVCQIYRDAATELGVAFSCTQDPSAGFTAWDALRIWPMRISDAYLNLLSQHHPGALILVAYYCILLQRLDSHWYFEGRAKRLLFTAMSCLDRRWHHVVEWPLAEIEDMSSIRPKTFTSRPSYIYDKPKPIVLLLYETPAKRCL
ncbi:hypothetical protein V500_09928 [Pseudogymnoascus sp. VKM F-4518 (FW-2643)]|nr:hypothetical protein V500_09928 [Pseudogymnoascus sp. VKM F-4518 (FW-2643)]